MTDMTRLAGLWLARDSSLAGKEQWPHPGEKREDFIDRCVVGLTAGGMDKDKANDVCAAKWRDANKGGG
jgi:hypothetical protein